MSKTRLDNVREKKRREWTLGRENAGSPTCSRDYLPSRYLALQYHPSLQVLSALLPLILHSIHKPAIWTN